MFKQAVIFLLFILTVFSAGLIAQPNTALSGIKAADTPQTNAAITQKKISNFLNQKPSLAIIIDDLGNNLASGRRAVNLPGSITYAILPHTPQARELANYVNSANHANSKNANKEVIIHMPMEAVGHKPIGPGGLKMHQDQDDFIQTLQAAIQALPHAKGLSNHMGSQLTSQPDRMHWLMTELSKTPFYFIDSKTTDNSAAMHAAHKQQIPYLVRDVFLDHDPAPAAIDKAYKKALALAYQSGSAVLIAHPYATTLDYLERELPKLSHAGIVLVNASQAIARKHRQQYDSQQMSSLPLLLVSNTIIKTPSSVTTNKPSVEK